MDKHKQAVPTRKRMEAYRERQKQRIATLDPEQWTFTECCRYLAQPNVAGTPIARSAVARIAVLSGFHADVTVTHGDSS